eukprot:jgi/Mesen1/7109/ME000369S06434
MALSAVDTPTVYALLQNALSQDEQTRKPAEAALASCENRPGFCSCLLEVLAAKELDKQGGARWLAVVYFKNSINRYWRTRRETPGITAEEKPHLRARLLDRLQEENNQVAVQLAVLISKIARFDYPREWPELFPALISKLQSPDVLLTQRVYLVLNQVLKELSSKRLGVDQKNFASVSQLALALAMVQGFSNLLAPAGSRQELTPQGEHDFSLACDRWSLCLKTIRRMLIFGFQSDSKSLQHSRFMPFVEKAALRLMKAIVAVQETHPYSFSHESVLLPVLSFCYSQVQEGGAPGSQPQAQPSLLQAGVGVGGSEGGGGAGGAAAQAPPSPPFEAFLILAMTLLQNVLKCVPYRQVAAGRVVGEAAPSAEAAKGQLAARAQQLVQSFFDKERLVHLCTILIQRYFVLTQHDLEEWAADPEGFNHEQDLVQWRDHLRPCAEALLLTMFESHKEVLAPVVMDMMRQASQACPPPALDADVAVTAGLLLKDACYDAVGVANYDLYDWMANRHPNNRILRRRVAWLLGQWVNKIKDDMRRPVYQALISLLADGDLAIQLAACRSLHTLMDDVHFYADEFGEFVAPCLERLFLFMQRATDFDSQLQVMNLFSLIIDRLGEKVVPCAEQIMSFLPQVWHKSEGQSLLRIQVILALQRLVVALGARSPLCYELLLPILQYSTDISQPDELNMIEDGMQLWEVTLQHAPKMEPQLLALFPHLVAIMTRNFDHLLVAMQLIECYILVGGIDFLQQHAAGVVQILGGVVGFVNEKGTMATLAVIDTFIQCFPREAPPALEQVLQRLILIAVGTTDDADLVRATAATVLARVLLQNSAYFLQLLSLPATYSLLQGKVAASEGATPLLIFCDAWLDKVDSVSSAAKRKLSALGLCVLLAVPEPRLLDRFEQIVSVCISAAHESQEGKDGNSAFELDYTWPNGDAGSNGSESTRKQQVYGADPVNTMSVAALLQEKLQAARHCRQHYHVHMPSQGVADSACCYPIGQVSNGGEYFT